jgi:hypothetical protein
MLTTQHKSETLVSAISVAGATTNSFTATHRPSNHAIRLA